MEKRAVKNAGATRRGIHQEQAAPEEMELVPHRDAIRRYGRYTRWALLGSLLSHDGSLLKLCESVALTFLSLQTSTVHIRFSKEPSLSLFHLTALDTRRSGYSSATKVGQLFRKQS